MAIQASVESGENIAAILGYGGWDPEIFDDPQLARGVCSIVDALNGLGV